MKKVKIEPKELFSNSNMSLFDNGEMGLSDGVGFCGALNKEEVKELYEALKKYFNSQERK